ncbi:MAG: FIST N-terminal domain-containing protein [Winogradskyella arenosi]
MYIKTTNIKAIADKVKLHVNGKTALIFISEEMEIDVLELIKNLNERCVNFVGGIFPKVISNHVIYDKGLVIGTIAEAVDSFIVKDLNSGNYNIPTVRLNENTNYCAFTFVDGLSSNISDYLSELYKTFGSQLSYFGGGAGSISLQQKPCVFQLHWCQ